MRKSTPITAVNLKNGRHIDFGSLSQASNVMEISYFKIKQMLQQKTAYLHWYVYLQGHDNIHADKVERLMKQYKKFGPIKQDQDTLVSLRIDSHTVIMVPRYKATDKYAQKYRERLEKARK